MHNRRCFPSSFVRFLFLIHTGVFWWCLSVAASVHAAIFTVDRTDDTAAATACDDAAHNDCSLRGAILAANARPTSEASTVGVPAGTYVLSQFSSCTYSRQLIQRRFLPPPKSFSA